MSTGDRFSGAVEWARAVVPAGETLRGEHTAVVATRAPKPGQSRRPRALHGERRTLYNWCLLPVYTAVLLTGITWNPFVALFEAVTESSWSDKQRQGRPFGGGWNSSAGQLARALHPRSRNGADAVIQVTDHRLQVAHVSHAGSLRGTPRRAEAGWSLDVRQVSWIRDRSDIVGGCHEIGFADGSWCSVQFQGHGWRRMPDAFPYRLSHLDPHPYGG
ncbi:hypothetical protein [Streptomyces boluensis]|uniref:Uncharacterized protein n=1 Tax=Streptomyces boluensis TaxID=1775135 RepID=A0A964UWA0_9ACTN|nr:hypothetical protein [Streptomyces boluensis]NBE56599.1 hypothetical protein [Streptomyces boluensis]